MTAETVREVRKNKLRSLKSGINCCPILVLIQAQHYRTYEFLLYPCSWLRTLASIDAAKVLQVLEHQRIGHLKNITRSVKVRESGRGGCLRISSYTPEKEI